MKQQIKFKLVEVPKLENLDHYGIEISNPGGLVSAIKKEEFGKKSVSRNPLLFSLFKIADLVEKVGSGVGRMRNAMRDAGLPAPQFDFTDFFTVTFKRPSVPIGSKEQTRLVEGLVESQKKIIELIRENPYISKFELSKRVGISTTAIDKNILRLKDKGLIKRVGPDKGGHWEIILKEDNKKAKDDNKESDDE